MEWSKGDSAFPSLGLSERKELSPSFFYHLVVLDMIFQGLGKVTQLIDSLHYLPLENLLVQVDSPEARQEVVSTFRLGEMP